MKNRKHLFQKQIDRWLDEASGDREVLIDQIVSYLQDGDLADYELIADFCADELLKDTDDDEQEEDA